MGIAMQSATGNTAFKVLLADGRKVTLEEAIFKSSKDFRPATLKDHLQFWEHDILQGHPNKANLLKWIAGVKIEDFLQPFTEGIFQNIPMYSFYPKPKQFENYVSWIWAVHGWYGKGMGEFRDA